MRRPSSSLPASTRSPAAPMPTCIAAARGRSASTQGSRPPRSRTSASATCSHAARPGSRSRSTCRRSSGSTPTTRSRAARSGGPASRSTRSPTWRSCWPASRSAEVSTSMTINAPASLLLLLYELVAEEQGVPGTALRGTVQNDMLKEYIARGNYIFPPRPSMRLTTDLFAYCAERIPSWNTISISGYHIREAGSTAAQELAFTVANGIAYCAGRRRGRALAGRLRRTALVLLQRAQRLLPGGREVPGSAAPVGARDARAVRRETRRRSRCASTRRRAARR